MSNFLLIRVSKFMSSRRKTYTTSDLQAALDYLSKNSDGDITHQDIDEQAKLRGIPNSTLRSYVDKNQFTVQKLGRKPLLTEEQELLLANLIKTAAEEGEGWSFETTKDISILYYQSLYIQNLVSVDLEKLSNAWFQRFFKRHKISFLKANKLSKARAEALDRRNLMAFKISVKRFVNNVGITEENIWTADETTSIPKDTAKERVCAAKGTKVLSFRTTIKVPKFSLLCCVSASGCSIPPQIILPFKGRNSGRQKKHEIDISTYMKDSSVVHSCKGCNTMELFDNWIFDVFAKKSRENRRDDEFTLLCIDNCSSHFSMETIEKLFKKKIVLAYFPPNATHVISPLDVTVFGPFKRSLSEALSKRRSLKYEDLAEWFGPSYEEVFIPSTIKSGFSSTGIWNYDRMEPDIEKIPSQYEKSVDSLPKNYKKQTKERRESMAMKDFEKKMNTLLKNEDYKAEYCGGVIGGKDFCKKYVGGAVVTDSYFSQLQEQKSELEKKASLRREQHIEEKKKIKEREKTIAERKIAKMKETNSTLKLSLRNEKKEKIKNSHECIKLENLLRNERGDKEELAKAVDALFSYFVTEDFEAEDFKSILEDEGINMQILKRNCQNFNTKNPRKKRRKN